MHPSMMEPTPSEKREFYVYNAISLPAVLRVEKKGSGKMISYALILETMDDRYNMTIHHDLKSLRETCAPLLEFLDNND